MTDEQIVQPCDLVGIYGELAELIPLEQVILIYMHFKGQQVAFPTRLYTAEFVIAQFRNSDSKSFRKIATQYGYSERRLRQLINCSKDKE